MRKPKASAVIWMANDIPESEKRWLLDRANHREGAEALAKPIRDGQIVNVTMLYQTQQRRDKTVQVRVGASGTRRASLFEDQLIQLPLDAWGASDADFETARLQQLALNRSLTDEPIGSLTDAKRRIDFNVHDKMSFKLMDEVADEDLTQFLEHSQGGNFMPWVRSASAGMRFARPVFLRDRIKRLLDGIIDLRDRGVGFRLRRSFEFEFQSVNDNCPLEEDIDSAP